MSPDRQALLSLYHDDATALLDRVLQAQHEPEGLHVVHAALVEALADAHTDGRPLDVSTTVPDETIAAIEARLNAASDAYYEQLAPRCSYRSAGDGMACGLMSGHDGPHTMLIPPSNGWGLVADTTKDLRALLSGVRRLTDANARLTDLVRHQRGALHTEGLITDAEYAALAGLTGSPARLEGYDALRGELALQKRATNVAIGERDEARADVAWLTEEVTQQTGATVDSVAEGLALARAGGIHRPVVNVRMGDALRARFAAENERDAARLDGARAMRDDIADRLADSDIAPFALVAEIRAIDPAAVVGSGS